MDSNEEELLDIYQEYIHLKTYSASRNLRENPQLGVLALVVTEMCNARCAHCNMSCDNRIKKENIDSKYFKKVLKEISENYNARNITISYTGGEPLMRKDLFDIIEYANELGYNGVLATNGSLLTEKTIERLVKSNVRAVCMSIDGLQETHEKFRGLPGVYPKLMKYLKIISKREDMEAGVTTVVNKTNINELEDLYKQFCDIGIQYWRVFPVDPEGNAKEHSDIILDKEDFERTYEFVSRVQKEGKINVSVACGHFLGLKYERMVRQGGAFFCSSGTGQATILSNGDIIGCANVPKNALTIQGNIKRDSFVDVWQNKFKIYRNINAKKINKCANCKHWRSCLGDAMHTYDFEKLEPGYCLKDILKF